MKKVSLLGVSIAFFLLLGILSGYLTRLRAAPESDQPQGATEQGVSVECLQGFLSDIQGCLSLPTVGQLSCVLDSVQTLLACLSGGDGGGEITDVSLTNDLQFVPSEVVIHVGDTVRWTNTGSIFHTVTSGTDSSELAAGALFDQPMPAGAVFEFTFTTPGTFPYFCRPHEDFGMRGTVVVNP
jgi:plastocyanin